MGLKKRSSKTRSQRVSNMGSNHSEVNQKKRKNEKYIYIEAMRIAAAFAVIFNHTGGDGFLLFSKMPLGGAKFWIYLFFSVSCKFAVPLFLAISGALLLNKEDEPLKDLWLKRILRIAVILVVYSLIYYVIDITKSGRSFEIRKFLKTLYSTNVKTHLWYLYQYIAFLIVIPFLRPLVRNLDSKYFVYLLAIAVFSSGIRPSAEYLMWHGKTSINSNIRLDWILDNAVIYPCLGYFMHHRVSTAWIKKHLGWVWALNIAGLACSCYMTFFKMSTEAGTTELQSFHKSFVVLNCVAIYLSFKLLFDRIRPGQLSLKIIGSLGKCSLGIYLWHIMIKDLSAISALRESMTAAGLNQMISVWIVCLIVMAIAYLITLIQSRIPLLKKLVGF